MVDALMMHCVSSAMTVVNCCVIESLEALRNENFECHRSVHTSANNKPSVGKMASLQCNVEPSYSSRIV